MILEIFQAIKTIATAFLGTCRVVFLARLKKIGIVEAIGHKFPVKLLYMRKIVDMSWKAFQSYAVGRYVIAPLSDDDGNTETGLRSVSRNPIIAFRNEYLIAYHSTEGKDESEKEGLCVVPDPISVLGSD